MNDDRRATLERLLNDVLRPVHEKLDRMEALLQALKEEKEKK